MYTKFSTTPYINPLHHIYLLNNNLKIVSVAIFGLLIKTYCGTLFNGDHFFKRRYNIRLSTKFWRFFQKFYFCFFTSKVQLVFRYIFTITIYHLSPTFWQRRDPALVEVLGFFIKELDKLRFDIAFVLELFIT